MRPDKDVMICQEPEQGMTWELPPAVVFMGSLVSRRSIIRDSMDFLTSVRKSSVLVLSLWGQSPLYPHYASGSLALLMCGMARDGIAVQGIAHARKSRTHDIKGKVVVFVYTDTYIECCVFIKMILTLQRSKTVHYHAVWTIKAITF